MMMDRTAFPTTPDEVAALTPQEFTFDLNDLDGNHAPSMDRVCRTFMDDANRALVWWIRFGALKAWCARTDVMAPFYSALAAVTVRRARARSKA